MVLLYIDSFGESNVRSSVVGHSAEQTRPPKLSEFIHRYANAFCHKEVVSMILIIRIAFVPLRSEEILLGNFTLFAKIVNIVKIANLATCYNSKICYELKTFLFYSTPTS